MRKKVNLIVTLLVIALTCGFSIVPMSGATLGDGHASSEDIPEGFIPIYTAEDLNKIRNNRYGKYILMNDIDLKGYNWEPIDYYNEETGEHEPFYGVFDGNGHKIKNLRINKPDEDMVGLFACIGNRNGPAVIKNLILENVDIVGRHSVGGLVGKNASGYIENVKVIGNIKGDTCVGGIAGTDIGIIRNCHTDGVITGNDYTSEIVGHGIPGPSIEGCSSTAIVNGKTGTLVGGYEKYGTTFNGASDWYGFWVSFKYDKVEIYDYTGTPDREHVVIPSHIFGWPVTELHGAFYCAEYVKSVVIPDTVERLINAFDYCRNLHTVVVPESVKLVQRSFGTDTREGLGVKEVIFEGMDTEIDGIGDVLIKCKAGSKAHEYALKFKKRYELIP